jgi:hypothetical protein
MHNTPAVAPAIIRAMPANTERELPITNEAAKAMAIYTATLQKIEAKYQMVAQINKSVLHQLYSDPVIQLAVKEGRFNLSTTPYGRPGLNDFEIHYSKGKLDPQVREVLIRIFSSDQTSTSRKGVREIDSLYEALQDKESALILAMQSVLHQMDGTSTMYPALKASAEGIFSQIENIQTKRKQLIEIKRGIKLDIETEEKRLEVPYSQKDFDSQQFRKNGGFQKIDELYHKNSTLRDQIRLLDKKINSSIAQLSVMQQNAIVNRDMQPTSYQFGPGDIKEFGTLPGDKNHVLPGNIEK